MNSDATHPGPSPGKAKLVAVFKILTADRQNWAWTPETLSLWSEEFKGLDEVLLNKAARAFLRQERGFPSISGLWKAIEAVREEDRASTSVPRGPLPSWESIQAIDEPVSAQVMKEHPYYDPDATMVENRERCRAWRDRALTQGESHE